MKVASRAPSAILNGVSCELMTPYSCTHGTAFTTPHTSANCASARAGRRRPRPLKVERLVKEVLPIKRIPLCRTKPSVADNPSQLFLGRAVSHPGGANHVFFEHHRAHIVPAKTQTHLADFESLRDPARLHVKEVRKIKSRNGEDLQVIDRRGFVPVPSAQGSVLRLKAPRDERREPARFLLQFVEALEVVDAVLITFSPPPGMESRPASRSRRMVSRMLRLLYSAMAMISDAE